MSLSDEYAHQGAWRAWSEAMALLPPLGGQTVLDLGCGIGDQAAELVKRGARVIGIDANEELLATARARGIPRAEFLRGDLRTLDEVGVVDGIWCSFAVAYVPELGPTLACWKQHLRQGGWVALTEVDDLLGHEPIEPRTRSLLMDFAEAARATNRYDFRMGRKLRSHLENAGFGIASSEVLHDRELSFAGPAEAAVLAAWGSRLNRMQRLQDFCGGMFERIRDDFLAALSHADHRSFAKVYYCIGTL